MIISLELHGIKKVIVNDAITAKEIILSLRMLLISAGYKERYIDDAILKIAQDIVSERYNIPKPEDCIDVDMPN